MGESRSSLSGKAGEHVVQGYEAHIVPNVSLAVVGKARGREDKVPLRVQPPARGKEAFDKFIRNERRIETCFEGTRFFDLRRWTTTLGELNREVHGVAITRNAADDYTYDFGHVVENRSFTSAYWPIPYKEMLSVNGLIQNEGWESWQ